MALRRVVYFLHLLRRVENSTATGSLLDSAYASMSRSG